MSDGVSTSSVERPNNHRLSTDSPTARPKKEVALSESCSKHSVEMLKYSVAKNREF